VPGVFRFGRPEVQKPGDEGFRGGSLRLRRSLGFKPVDEGAAGAFGFVLGFGETVFGQGCGEG
jgi:hypothetical protein